MDACCRQLAAKERYHNPYGSAHHRIEALVGDGPYGLGPTRPVDDGGDGESPDPLINPELMCQRDGVVDDDGIRKRAAAGSARPDASLVQSSLYGSPDLLDRVQPALR